MFSCWLLNHHYKSLLVDMCVLSQLSQLIVVNHCSLTAILWLMFQIMLILTNTHHCILSFLAQNLIKIKLILKLYKHRGRLLDEQTVEACYFLWCHLYIVLNFYSSDTWTFMKRYTSWVLILIRLKKMVRMGQLGKRFACLWSQYPWPTVMDSTK